MPNYSAAQITSKILETTEEFFQEDGDAQDLRVAVRISCDVRDFIEKQGNQPDSQEADYMMGTIVSGVESFFQVGHSCRCFVGLEETWQIDKQLPTTFVELKKRYLRHFEDLANEELHPRERLQALLSLSRLQLLLLAHLFPWGRMN